MAPESVAATTTSAGTGRTCSSSAGAAALAGALCFPLLAHATPAAGDEAREFALKDLSGRNQRLSEFRGEVVVLTFWASYCGPCREALQSADAAVAAVGALAGPLSATLFAPDRATLGFAYSYPAPAEPFLGGIQG